MEALDADIEVAREPQRAPRRTLPFQSDARDGGGRSGAQSLPSGAGDVLGNYRLVRLIGRGGMGSVYAAEHTRIDRRAAVKVLRPELAADPEVVQRFLVEARAASMVRFAGSDTRHPGIVEIFDCGRDPAGAPFIVMEYLQGESLAATLERVGSLAGDRGALGSIGTQIASAMTAAHASGIVHRDLKPDNVFLTSDLVHGQALLVKVLDFGIAKLFGMDQGASGPTRPGLVMGTPLYMSPEQCRGDRDLSAETDVYSLGCILFQMACGRTPFVYQSAGELMAAHLNESPSAPSGVDPRVPPELDELVLQMLEKDPGARPASMAEVEERLLSLASGQGPATLVMPKEAAGAGAVRAHFGANGQPSGRPATPYPAGDAKGKTSRNASPQGDRHTRASSTAPARTPHSAAREGASGQRLPVKLFAAAAGAVLVLATSAAAWKLRTRPALRDDRDRGGAAAARGVLSTFQDMVEVGPGAFRMGSTDEEVALALDWCRERGLDCRPEILNREKPPRQVSVSGFLIDRTEVTNERFKAWLEQKLHPVDGERFVRDEGGRLLADLYPGHAGVARAGSGYVVRSGQADRPIVQVTWFGADEYCRDLGKRLPTEAEWEFAARGAGRRTFPWGDRDPSCQDAVHGRKGSGCPDGDGPARVGSSPGDVTPEGVADLGGNVAEWVSDAFQAPYQDCAPDCANPVARSSQGELEPLRVIRGGDWEQGADVCRAAGRSRSEPGKAMANVGFRCARGLQEAAR